MFIRRPEAEEFNDWLNMRIDLWPDCPRDEHILEMSQYYDGKPMGDEIETQILVCEIENGELGGFIELSLRNELDGFNTSPIGYMEGWYVKKYLRQKGLGSILVNEGERWAVDKGCTEMASDAEKDNSISIEAHIKLGYTIFSTTEDEVLFRKVIKAT